MFEKNRASNITSATVRIAACICLTGGQRVCGYIVAAGSGRLSEILNGPAPFVEFHTLDGEVRHFNKQAIVSLDPVDVPNADHLARRNADAAAFDPYAVLGLSCAATPEQVREAYVALARTYHPDRYAAAGLPREVTDYISAMAKRINAAWDILSRHATASAARSV